MKVILNGETVDCESGLTVADVLKRHGLPPETTLVEHNGLALRQRDWPERPVQEGDRFEILRVAAGG